MFEVVPYYLLALLIFQPIEEIHNCNNPNLTGLVPNYVCVWEEDDFYTSNKGKKILRPKRKADNKIKAHYRKKYWDAK